ncbi:MAG: Virulence sensor protein BvgS [Anaerolineales bacterium]|nr:Virulence sensor protein BvgS [Anaerolineales bacterium]
MEKNLQQIEELILQFDLARIVLAEEEEEEVTTVVSLRDITERKQAAEAIRQKTEQQEVLLSSIPAFVYFKDTESKLITANKTFAEMVNTPIDQLPGKEAYDLFPKEQAEKFHVDDRKVMESGRPMMNIEEEFTDAEGKTRWASTSKVPYFDETGEVAGMVGTTFDITERKRAEREIEERRMYLEGVLGAAPDAIVTMDATGRIVEWNPGAERLFGYLQEEVVG